MSEPVKYASSVVVTLMNGAALRLSAGEINAVNRFAWMNGTAPESTQWDPGHVRYTTRNSLVTKGLMVPTGDGLIRFAPGMIPEVEATVHQEKAFDLLTALAAARSAAGEPEPSAGTARALGENQISVLSDLGRTGEWYPGCGWYYNTVSGTTRIMKSLAKRGLALDEGSVRAPHFRITESGRAALLAAGR